MGKNKSKISIICSIMTALLLVLAPITPISLSASAVSVEPVELNSGVNKINTSYAQKSFDIDSDKALSIKGNTENPVVFTDCEFNISGKSFDSNKNTTVNPKISVGDNVIFNNCKFVAKDGSSLSGRGSDCCISLSGKDSDFNGCEIDSTAWEGQFIGTFGNSVTSFDNSKIKIENNKGGWCFASYGDSVIKFNKTDVKVSGLTPINGSINVFYAGDNGKKYNSVYILNQSNIEFCDNSSGGFALNSSIITIDNSKVNVSYNAGNASNSGYWNVKNSELDINHNKSHGLSCSGFDVDNSVLNVIHNGYAGVYIAAADSLINNSTVNINGNGERLSSYSAGDIWLNNRTLTCKQCDSLWLGAVTTTSNLRTGSVITEKCSDVVAYDLGTVKGRPLVISDSVTLDNSNLHTLFLNPDVEYDYAKAISEKAPYSDSDLLDKLTSDGMSSLTSKIGTLTDSQLSHHSYDWANGNVISKSDKTHFGIMKYTCNDCDNTDTIEHPYSFVPTESYVYSPLVGISFNSNLDGETVTNMPTIQDTVSYGTSATVPQSAPKCDGYKFIGWYSDKECTQTFDFSTVLSSNWTEAYAGWAIDITDPATPIDPPTTPTNPVTPTDPPKGTVDNTNDIIEDDETPLSPPTLSTTPSKNTTNDTTETIQNEEISLTPPSSATVTEKIEDLETPLTGTTSKYETIASIVGLGAMFGLFLLNKKRKNK